MRRSSKARCRLPPTRSERALRSSMSGRTEKSEWCVRAATNLLAWQTIPIRPGRTPCVRTEMPWSGWLNKKEPPSNKVGFMYMMAGGTDASNTDPYAQKPEPNNNWVETGPHVMIVGAKGLLDAYPRNAKPDTSVPYVK